MDAFPKFLASAVVIVFAVFIGISLIIAGTSAVSAKSFYSSVADAIGAATEEHEDAVIHECVVLAENNGYMLQVQKIPSGEGSYYFELKLSYKFTAPFLGKTNVGKVTGYVYPGTHTSRTQ